MRRLAWILILFAPATFAQAPPDATALEAELGRFTEVLALVEENAADPVSVEQVLHGGAIPGMLRKLDPHSVFFNRDQFEQLQEMQKDVAKGFGSIVSVLPGRVIVLETQAGSPSQRAGLSPGDEIVIINNIPLAGLEIEQLAQLLGMARKRPVQIRVRRQGTAGLLTLTMTPAELQSPSVDRAFLLEPGVGYVRATSFEMNTGREVREAIERLGGTSLRGLVLDLRENPGGVLAAAMETAALFLKPGLPLLSARGRSAKGEEVKVPEGSKPYEFKLAVLMNAKSASGAEIVAGSVQDHDRGLILGEASFGKGLVQRVFPLSEGTGLALTTAFYYTPSGRSIQRPLRSGELESATSAAKRPEYKTSAGRTVLGGGGIEPDVAVRPEPPTRLREVIEATASFANFATEWLVSHRGEVTREMEVSAATLDEFQLFLSRRNIRPGLKEWTAERPVLMRRLKQEILNQALGVGAGDEVELRSDPSVRRALAELSR
jgi:carboxyl-terminal processing protease